MRSTRHQLRRIIREAFAATAAEEAEKVNAQAGTSLVTDQAHWEELGIRTGEELAKELLFQTYSDTFKDLYGTRPHHLPWKEMTVDEIQASLASLEEEWMELRHTEDQDDWVYASWEQDASWLEQMGLEPAMMTAVEEHPEELPEDYIEYEKFPATSGMGRRVEGIVRVTKKQLRRIIRETLLAEDKSGKGACPDTGCIKKSGDKWRIISNKTGKLWPQKYDTKKSAEDALDAYHASR